MAQLLKSDELNILRFFEPMAIDDNERNRRVSLARDLYFLYRRAFTLYNAMIRVDNIDAQYLKTYVSDGYRDALNDAYDYIDDYFEEYILMSVNSVVETTLKQGDTTSKRALEIAENDANCLSNYAYDKRMKEEGFTTKRWDTMRDERVRHTHIIADGQEVAIDEPFVVGDSKMMYPTDISLGADANEIINCRCVAKYF